jgi:formate/nitrite transporter FocA (FNT family)
MQSAGKDEQAPKKGPHQILRSEMAEAKDALHRSVSRLFVSGLSAGLDVGFSVLLMATMWTEASGQLSKPVTSMLVAAMYSVGFIFVVIGRSELFTEQTTLAVLPVLSGKTSIVELLRLWGIVLFSNIIGAAVIAWLIVRIAPALGVVDEKAFGFLAGRMVFHSGSVMFFSAVLAGWLMGLLSWLVAAGRDTISQIVIVWLITAAIGFAGLHHVVLGSVEVLAGVFSHQGVTILDFGRFLFFVTVGNILGGVIFVALIKYGHARQGA